jgi:hypothetical protein
MTVENTRAHHKHVTRRHAMPGRVRLHVPKLHHQPQQVAQVTQKLRGVKGIHHVEGNATTGNLTVHYDPNALNSMAFLGEVAAALGLVAEGIDPSTVEDLFQLVGVTPSMLVQSLEEQGFVVPLVTFAAGWFIGSRLA